MSIADIIYIAVFVFVIAVVAIVLNMAFTPVVNAFIPILNSTPGGNETMTMTTGILNDLDFIVVGIAFGAMLFAVVSAWFIQSHPIFIWPTIIFGAIALFLAPFFANAFGGFISSPSVSATATRFPMTVALLQYYPYFILTTFILIAIVTLGKPASGYTR